MSATTTGKNLNLTIENLSGMELELRPLDGGGGEWDISGKLFRGELYDERTDEKVGDIECLVSDTGRVVCRFPGMGRGRYSFAVFMSGADGGEVIFVDGYVGYSAPAATGGGFVESVNRVVNVIVDGARRIAVYAHTSAAERAADRAEEALEGIGEQVERLDAVQEATDALRAGISTAVRINDYGRWQIGEVDSGVKAQGPAGQSGAEVQYHVIASEADLPTDAEHCSSLHRYLIRTTGTYARGESYMRPVPHGDDDPQIELKIAGVSYVVTGQLAAATWTYRLVEAINDDSNCPVTAERQYDQAGYTLILTAKVAGAAGNWIPVEASGSGGAGDFIIVPNPPMSGGTDATTFQYVWADGAWVKLPLDAGSIATPQSHGLVKLGRVGGSGDKVPVVEGSDGGIYCDRAPHATVAVKGLVKLSVTMSDDEGVPVAKDAKDYADEAAREAAEDACETLEDTLHTYIAQQIAEALSSAINVPTGGMVTYWGDEVPDGWLECDGSEVLRADYPALFAVIGTTFGVPSSETKFKLPDLRDRFVRYMGEDHTTLGEKEEPALPNIKGGAGWIENTPQVVWSNGALSYENNNTAGTYGGGGNAKKFCTLRIDASSSSSVYQDGETEVKVKALVGKAIIKC